MRIAAALCCLLLTACLGASPHADLSAALDAQLRTNAEHHGIPAQAVLIMRNGEVVYRNQIGVTDLEAERPAAPGDIYAAYSVSKLLASILVLQLVDDGRLDLLAPASRYAPGLPASWRDITVDQFLNHASGVPDYFDGANPFASLPPTREGAFRALAGQPLDFEPGTQTRYNQTNYVVLMEVLERIHGAPYREIVRTRIVEPLGLQNTFLGADHTPSDRLVTAYVGKNGRLVRDPTLPWREYSIAHAELYATPDDLGAFLSAVARGDLVDRQTLLRAWRPFQLQNGETGFASGWDNGESNGYREVGMDGGVKVRVRILFSDASLNDHTIIVYLTNGTRDGVWTRTLVESIERIVLPDRTGPRM